MLQLYVEQENKADVIVSNDIYFDFYIDNVDIDNNIANIIKKIDGVDYVGNHRIISKFDRTPTSIKHISTGCKTAINIYLNPNVIFNIGECGDNALTYIMNMRNGKAFTSCYIMPYDFENDINVICAELNINTVVHCSKDLIALLYSVFGGNKLC